MYGSDAPLRANRKLHSKLVQNDPAVGKQNKEGGELGKSTNGLSPMLTKLKHQTRQVIIKDTGLKFF